LRADPSSTNTQHRLRTLGYPGPQPGLD